MEVTKERVDYFLKQSIILISESLSPTIFGTHLILDEGSKFYTIRGINLSPSYPKGYTFARIDKSSGDIYSASGNKSKGSIFSEYNGLECVDSGGVIVNEMCRRRRLDVLLNHS